MRSRSSKATKRKTAKRKTPNVSAFPNARESGESIIDWLKKNPVSNANLPADFALQHDHYLYGTLKKD